MKIQHMRLIRLTIHTNGTAFRYDLSDTNAGRKGQGDPFILKDGFLLSAGYKLLREHLENIFLFLYYSLKF